MRHLQAEKFFSDPAFKAAKKTILDTLYAHQKHITCIKPADPERLQSYEKTLKAFSRARGGNLFFPYIGSGLGNGPFVELEDGSIKYDFISGIGTHHFGHSHPKIIEAALDASVSDTIMQGNLQQTKDSFNLSKKLLKAANAHGAKFAHCFLTTTGVMAGENALKLAFQKNHPANRILAFDRCFAGRTTTFSHITDKAAYRGGIPTGIQVDYIPFFDAANPEKSTEAAVLELKKHIHRYPKQHAAMFFELVQGEGGYYEGSTKFHKTLMEICKEHNIAVLADEVQTFARLPELFAFQYYKLDQLIDVLWIGKASQVCATIFKKDFAPKPGLLSQTFTGSSTAIAAAEVIVDHLLKDNYFGPKGKIVKLHLHFRKELEAIHQRHPKLLRGPYGVGAMVAFTPFDGNPQKANEFIKKLFENGVLSFIAGANPTRVRFLPPIAVIDKHHITEVAQIIENTLLTIK